MNKEKRANSKIITSALVGLSSLLFLSLSFSGFTLAWINQSKTLTSVVNVESSKIAISNVNAKVYKYIYPSFNATSSQYDINYNVLNSSGVPTSEKVLIDYNSVGSVRTGTLSSSFAIKMNVFDPQYLLLNRYNEDQSGNPDPETISDLNTNLVVGVSFDLTYSFPVDVSLQVTKKAQETSALAGTDYLHYCGVLSTNTILGLVAGDTDTEIFTKVKAYSETTADNHNFKEDDTNGDSNLNMIENEVVDSNTSYSAEVTNTFTAYLNIDFDEYLTGVKKYDTDGTTQGSYYSSYENALYNKDLTTFHKLAPKATSLVLSSACNAIDVGACKSNTVLLMAALNNVFTSIPANLFSGDTSLRAMTLSSNITSIGNNAFDGCTSLATFKNTGTGVGSSGVLDCSTLFNSLESIGERSFYNCDGLTSFKANTSLTTIGKEAFRNSNNITSVTLGTGLTTLGASAFADCNSVTSLTIPTPSNVLTIGGYCFGNMDGLTSLTIPSSNITAIPDTFVQNSGNLATVSFGDTSAITSFGNTSFGNTGLTSFEVPSSVNTIGNNCFESDASPTSLTFKAGYSSSNSISIGDSAFKSCSSLTSIVLPAGVSFSQIATQSESAFLGWGSSSIIYLGTTGASFTAAKYPYNLSGTNTGSVWNAYKDNSTSDYYLSFYVYSADGSDLGSMNATSMPGYKGWWNGSETNPTKHNV